MKFKPRHLAAAAALVVMSAPAFAFLSGPDDGNGELVLNVWQQSGLNGGTASASYALDLGITYASFIANKDVNLYINQVVSDTYFSQLLSTAGLTASALEYSVFVGDRVDNQGLLISTYNGPLTKPSTNLLVSIALDQVANYTGALQATGNVFSATNGSGYSTSGDAYYQSNAGLIDLASSSFINSGLVGTSLGVAQVTSTGGPSLAPSKLVFPGVFSFAQTGGSYSLQYQVAAVPEPSGIAMALAGFGLIGFIGRRRKTR